MFEQFNIGALAGLFEQCLEDSGAGGIGGVNDAAMAVAAFTGEVELKPWVFRVSVLIAGEGHALVDQPLNGFATVFDRKTHGIFMTQAAPGIQGVFDVGLDCVGVIQYGSDAALCPKRRAVGQIALAQNCNAQMAWQ